MSTKHLENALLTSGLMQQAYHRHVQERSANRHILPLLLDGK